MALLCFAWLGLWFGCAVLSRPPSFLCRALTMWITQDMKYVNQGSVGFSGVIFTLALIQSYRSTQPTRSVFGMVQVPTRIYPWVLLIVLSVRWISVKG